MDTEKLGLSVLNQVFREAIKGGSDTDGAFKQACTAMEMEQRKARRRQIMSIGYFGPGEVPPKKKPITIWLEEADAAILDAEAQRLAGTPFTKKGGLPEFWRSAVIHRLLLSLNSDNQIPGNEILPNAIDSYYAERRQAAEARTATHEAERQAEIKALEQAEQDEEKAAQLEMQARQERKDAEEKRVAALKAAEIAMQNQDEDAEKTALQEAEDQSRKKRAATEKIEQAQAVKTKMQKEIKQRAKKVKEHTAKVDLEKAKARRMTYAGGGIVNCWSRLRQGDAYQGESQQGKPS